MAAQKRWAGKRGKGERAYRPEGHLRQSQLVTTFGPGAMVDLVDRAVVIGGLEHWSYGSDGFEALDDPRLRRSLLPRLKALDPDLDLAHSGYFRKAPACDNNDASPRVGVRALEFPRWFVCKGCRRLARAAEGFDEHRGRYRHECSRNRYSSAVPVRFVTACKRGHLSDFPWAAFAHMDGESGRTCENPTLFLDENALGELARIVVRCTNCGSHTAMSKATVLPFTCQGDRPWLGGRAAQEKCDQPAELLVRTASSAYFAQVVSAIRLREAKASPLRMRLRERDVWKAVQRITTADELAIVRKLMDHVGTALEGYAAEEVLAAIRAENGEGAEAAERPLRSAEFDRL